MLLSLIVAMTSPCQTSVADPHPPTNVRAAPNGPVVGTVTNGTVLTVDDDRGGWLHVTAPRTGWIYLEETTVKCGDENDMGTGLKALDALAASARSSRTAAELLVRYDLTTANAALNEQSDAGVGELMGKNPSLLISVLDRLTDAERRRELSIIVAMAASAADVSAFEHALAKNPSSPTAATWRAMPAKEKTGG